MIKSLKYNGRVIRRKPWQEKKESIQNFGENKICVRK